MTSRRLGPANTLSTFTLVHVVPPLVVRNVEMEIGAVVVCLFVFGY